MIVKPTGMRIDQKMLQSAQIGEFLMMLTLEARTI
jgi:hypothetical protein